MNRQINTKNLGRLLGLLFLVLIIASCSVFTGSQAQASPEGTASQAQTLEEEPQKWEYKVLRYDDNVWGPFASGDVKYEDAGDSGVLVEDSASSALQERMNKLGQEGWELVSFTGEADGVSTVMIFKRAKK